MTMLAMKSEQYKFLVDGDLKARIDAVFERQGTSLTTGSIRLIEFFLDQPEEVQAMILGQVRGEGARDLTAIVLNRLAEEPPRGKGKRTPMRGTIFEKDGRVRHVET